MIEPAPIVEPAKMIAPEQILTPAPIVSAPGASPFVAELALSSGNLPSTTFS